MAVQNGLVQKKQKTGITQFLNSEKVIGNIEQALGKMEIAEAEQGTVVKKDFSKVEAILQSGWKDIYNALDDEHKRAFWRSFIKSIEIHWTTDKKEITKVNFF